MDDARIVEALRLASFGFSVIPVHAGEKVPARRWKRRQTVRAGERLIRQWWHDDPTFNPGIVTGSVSGVYVLDVDPRNGGLSSIRGKTLPETPTVETPHRGWHYYYACAPGTAYGNRNPLSPGVEFKGKGGMVIGAGARHEDGGAWEWAISPDDVPYAPLPSWVEESLSETAPADVLYNPVPDRFSGELPTGVRKGHRSTAAARYTGTWLAQGCSVGETRSRLWTWNQRNRPPLDDEELHKVLASIVQAELRKPQRAHLPRIPRELLRIDVGWGAKVMAATWMAIWQTEQRQPHPTELAELLGVTDRAIRRWRGQLESAGWWPITEERPRRCYFVVPSDLLMASAVSCEAKGTGMTLAQLATAGKTHVGFEALGRHRNLERGQLGAHVQMMEGAGLLEVERASFSKAGGRRDSCNRYTILWKSPGCTADSGPTSSEAVSGDVGHGVSGDVSRS
jgi:hypothetical protein